MLATTAGRRKEQSDWSLRKHFAHKGYSRREVALTTITLLLFFIFQFFLQFFFKKIKLFCKNIIFENKIEQSIINLFRLLASDIIAVKMAFT